MSNVYGRRGKWISMLQDFDFKIMHMFRSKHMNVDALSRNLMSGSKEDEDPKPKVPKKHATI
jgi:hypothetical protein